MQQTVWCATNHERAWNCQVRLTLSTSLNTFIPIYNLFLWNETLTMRMGLIVVINLPFGTIESYSLRFIEEGGTLQVKVNRPSQMDNLEERRMNLLTQMVVMEILRNLQKSEAWFKLSTTYIRSLMVHYFLLLLLSFPLAWKGRWNTRLW